MLTDNRLRDTLDALDTLIPTLRQQIDAEPPKPSIPDYVRVIQLRQELGKENGETGRGPVNVRWVDDETHPEPDPDPNIPWSGDEPL
ncbi:MAG: hypothetical protein K2X03_01770 [Bryobacteraceae bacterium]|nr:hypothetical protein [Bryobacteraceae bacterium]